MKKLFIILLILCPLVLSGCNNKKEKLLEPSKKDEIIVYSQSPSFGTKEDEYNFYYIKVMSDKKIVWGKAVSGVEGERELSNSEYNSLIKIAYKESLKQLPSDISDNSVTDGYSASILVYYEDGTIFETGGLNPTNKEFKKLVDKLKSLAK